MYIYYILYITILLLFLYICIIVRYIYWVAFSLYISEYQQVASM